MEEKKSVFADKDVLVVGLARSGVGASNLLAALGARVTVTDSKSRELLEVSVGKLAEQVRVITGGNPPDVFESCDIIVVSPGVPPDIEPLVRARRKGINIIGELELAYQVIQAGVMDYGSWVEEKTETRFIGITGTNGKSTVTTLVDLMLKNAGCRTLLGGNIGNALTKEILEKGVRGHGTGIGAGNSIDFVVAEVSSFQLESIERFRPHISAILNITPDHLNRYKGMDDYAGAKANIFKNQRADDFLVLNADDPIVMKMAGDRLSAMDEQRPNVFFFSRVKEVKGVYSRDGSLFCNVPNLEFPSSNVPFISLEEIRIKGVHNLENAMSAALIAFLSGRSFQPVRDALKTFSGLEHRLEFVCEINGVRFINDSKATNIGAVEKSLEGLDHVILIMGGMDKGGDFSALRDLVKKKVKRLVLIGEARQTIERALRGSGEIIGAADLKEAVALSSREASVGDIVLLSPGCASFDMFKDFEERGRTFKEMVREVHDQ